MECNSLTYYYFLDEDLVIVYSATFNDFIEARNERDNYWPKCTLAVQVKEKKDKDK